VPTLFKDDKPSSAVSVNGNSGAVSVGDNNSVIVAPLPPTPQDAVVSTGDIGSESPDWIAPVPLESLGVPPAFPPSTEPGSDHCGDWYPWLDKLGAAPILGISYINVAAPAGAEVSITDAQVRVTKKYAAPMTIVQCLYGAGGHDADPATINLDAPNPDLVVQSKEGDVTLKAGRGQYKTAPGSYDIIAISPQGTVGYMYEYQLTLTYVVNAKSATTVSPVYRFYMRPEMTAVPTAYDFDQASQKWFPVPAISF